MENSGTKVKYETLVILWIALLTSQLLFLMLVFFLMPQLFAFDLSKPPLGTQPLVVIVFAIMALIVFALSFVFRRQHLRRAVADHDATCVQTGLLLGCMLCELCTLLGVLLAFAFEYQYFFLWIALGTLGMLLHFPRRENLIAASYKQ